MKSVPAFPCTYELIRNSRSNHYFWIEHPTGRLTIGDHSGDGWYDEPPASPASCDDGILYVDEARIKREGITIQLQDFSNVWVIIPVLHPDNSSSKCGLGWHELKWLASRLQCQVHVVTKAFRLTANHDQLEAITK